MVSRSASQGMGPERFAIAPKRGLTPCAGHQHCEDHCRGDRAEAAMRRGPAPVGGRPHQGDGDADLRQVGEAVGHGHHSHLYQPDHGDQHCQIPEPADEQVGIPSPAKQNCRRNAQQEQRRSRDLPEGQVQSDARIQDGQADGIKELAQIGDIGIHRDTRPPQQREVLDRRQRFGSGPDRRHRGNRRQEQERKLLQHQLPVKRPSAQGPIIQQQQHHGHRYQRLLGHQAQGEDDDYEQITPRRKGPARVADVGGQGQDEKQSAQHVLSLGHPGHRFGA